MRTLSSTISAINKVNIENLCSSSVDQTKDDLLQTNKDQLFDGKLKTGQDLSPSYLDDPYFKSAASAQRYSDWKDLITPNANRKKGIPNLYINGAFYMSLSVEVAGSSVMMGSSFPDADDIESKFTKNIFGLGGQYKSKYITVTLQPLVFQKLITQLNSK